MPFQLLQIRIIKFLGGRYVVVALEMVILTSFCHHCAKKMFPPTGSFLPVSFVYSRTDPFLAESGYFR